MILIKGCYIIRKDKGNERIIFTNLLENKLNYYSKN